MEIAAVAEFGRCIGGLRHNNNIMFKKKKTYIIFGIIILIIGGYLYFKPDKSKVEYVTAVAQKGKLVRTVAATGSIEPENRTDLAFKTSGRVIEVNFDVGDEVKKGDIVAQVDRGTLGAELASTKAELEIQKRSLELKKRRDDLYKHEEIDAQRAAVEKAEASVNLIWKKINETALYSPMDGIITRRNIDPGENAVANSTIMTIDDGGELLVEIDIPESDIVDIAFEQKATVTLDAFSTDEKLDAEVIEIDPASTVIQDVVYYKIKLKLKNYDQRLRAGMSADADINIAEKNDVISVSQRAVKSEGNQEYVEILKTDNTLERKNVKTGLKGDEGMVEIVSGLIGGERVVTLTKTP